MKQEKSKKDKEALKAKIKKAHAEKLDALKEKTVIQK